MSAPLTLRNRTSHTRATVVASVVVVVLVPLTAPLGTRAARQRYAGGAEAPAAFVNPCAGGAVSGFRRSCFAAGADAGALPEVRILDPTSGPGAPPQSFFLAYDEQFTGGVRLALADLTSDGVADVITGAGPTGSPHVKVFDGVSSAVIRSFFAFPDVSDGISVAAGDVNGDGIPDIVVGHGSGLPWVRVFDGGSGAIIRDFVAYSTAFTGGVRVAAGDINADGYDDIVTGAGPGGGPHVQAFSGFDGTLLASFYAYRTTTVFGTPFLSGVHVAAGDIDADGFADIVTGSGGDPLVNAFSGKTGEVVGQFYAYSPTPLRLYWPGVRVAAGDLIAGADGRAEVVTSLEGSADRVSVWRGFTPNDWTDVFSSSDATPFVAATIQLRRMYIDVPVAGSTQSQPFTMSGWALQEAAVSSAGVEAIHVWAWPDTGGPAIFVGLATLGVPRHDVAALYGAQFTGAGFTVPVGGLPPGGYTFAIYVHSALSLTFNDRRIVHATVR